MRSLLHCTFSLALLLTAFAARAQVLFVNDNDNITYNTDTVLHDLAAAGIAVEVYDVAAQGAPPTLEQLYDHTGGVIWYCSSDGVGLGLWNDQQALYDLAGGLVPVWFIGTDMLYAGFGATPVNFQPTDLPAGLMGLASYDVQSYGDDGAAGCSELDVSTEAASAFAPTIQWAFPTAWWVDGCTLALDGADPIYRMGPMSYALQGAVSMVHNTAGGVNVMSSFFDPAVIDTYAHRVQFLQETFNYMDMSTGVGEASRPHALQLLSDGSGGVFLNAGVALRNVEVYGMNGQLEERIVAPNSGRVHVERGTLSTGLHVVNATTASGERVSAKWLVP